MSFCRQRTLRLFVLPISLVTTLLLYLGVHATAYAATGDDWAFSSQVPISPDPVYAQETPAIDASYVAWQGGIDYNGATKNRIFFKDKHSWGTWFHLFHLFCSSSPCRIILDAVDRLILSLRAMSHPDMPASVDNL